MTIHCKSDISGSEGLHQILLIKGLIQQIFTAFLSKEWWDSFKQRYRTLFSTNYSKQCQILKRSESIFLRHQTVKHSAKVLCQSTVVKWDRGVKTYLMLSTLDIWFVPSWPLFAILSLALLICMHMQVAQ